MVEAKRLVFQDNEGRVLRTFAMEGSEAHVVRRKDNRRMELHSSLTHLSEQGIEFTELGKISSSEQKPLLIGSLGQLSFVTDVAATQTDIAHENEKSKNWWQSLLLFALLGLLFAVVIVFAPVEPASIEEELKEHVVQVIKRRPEPPKTVAAAPTMPTTKKPTTKPVNVKRMGALSVLGSLKTGKQKGGVDIGAIQTSAGPGRGGTEGSGGVQTSLYGKGLVAAPVGAGSVQGAGGYGTKGAGGGQAGYGALSLVGSAGDAPLAASVVVDGGLDRDMIAAVIQKNMGQVRFCYEQGLQSNPGLAGRVAADFVIGGNGMVKTASVANSTLNAQTVEQCIMMRLKSWKFPIPVGGVDVKVSYPFLLKRVGG